jgi:hypothetical protein
MMNHKRKQIAALARLREHKENLARANLKVKMSELQSIHREKEKKDALVSQLTEELYEGLEDRVLTESSIVDYGARFATIAMTINAARENLHLEEHLAAELDNSLTRVRQDVRAERESVKVAYLNVKKVQHLSQKLDSEFQKSERAKEEMALEDIGNSRHMTPKYTPRL